MTYRNHTNRAGDAVDREVSRRDMGRCGHGATCRCIRNVGIEAFVRETERLRAEHDRLGYATRPEDSMCAEPGGLNERQRRHH